MKKIVSYFICVTLVLCHGVTRAQAQGASLSVSPAVTEIILAPNKQASQTFILKSNTDDLVVTPELHLFQPADQNGHAKILPEPLDPTSIPLVITTSGPTMSPTLTFEAASTDVPQDIYLALVFSTSETQTSDNLSHISPAISSLIILTINPSGNLPIDLQIQDFSPPFIVDTWHLFNLQPTIKNNSDISIRPKGQWSVTSPSGTTIQTLDIAQNLILGNSSRTIQGEDSLPLSWQPSWYSIGPHTLTLTITTQGGSNLSSSSQKVWFFPIRATILGFFFVILIYYLFSFRSND